MENFPKFVLEATDNRGNTEWKVIMDDRHLKAVIGGLKGKRTTGLRRRWYDYPASVKWWSIDDLNWQGMENFEAGD